MSKKIIIVSIGLLVSASWVQASQVFYLGGYNTPSNETNQAFGFKQRAKDLFDFSRYGQYPPQRSGMISGNIVQAVEYNKINGNQSKSFLEDGTDYISEAHLNLQERLPSNYQLESQVFLRKTDNRRVSPRRDVRAEDFNLKILNPEHLYEFGDFYGELSQFTAGISAKGFNVEYVPDSSMFKYKLIAAKTQGPDVAAELFQRNMAGAKLDTYLFSNSAVFEEFRIGTQMVSVQDDSSTVEHSSNAQDLRNSIASIDGDIKLEDHFSLAYEIARSSTITNEDLSNDTEFGTAMRFAPTIKTDKSELRYLYYRADPKFFTSAGSATADKNQHQVTLDYSFSQKMAVTLLENYYWDHLGNGTTVTKRATSDEKGVTFKLKPFDARTNFIFRPYLNWLDKRSDDNNSVESITRTAGFSLNDRFGRTGLGLRYEYRGFTDEANQSSSDYTNRFSFNVDHEQQFLSRRLYYSFEPGFDLRRTKTDDNQSLNVSAGLNAQYDASAVNTLRFGTRHIRLNDAQPTRDSYNNLNFFESDWALNRQRNMRFVLRAERNMYLTEDNGIDYIETRGIAKFVTNF